MTDEERQTLDVAAMQRELLSMAEIVRIEAAKANGLLQEKCRIDGELAMIKNKVTYIKVQMSAIQSALKSSTAL